MATYKGKLKQKTGSSTSDILYPATDATIVDYSNTTSGLTATTVQGAIDEIVSSGVGVTGVKGNAEADYRTGNVNLTPANIGAATSDHTHGNLTNDGKVGTASGKVITTTTGGAITATTENTAFNKNFETSTSNIKMDGSASVGSLSTVARADHIHPTDTSRLSTTPDGTNALIDSGNKISLTYLPDIILGQLIYGGTVAVSASSPYSVTATLSDNAKTKLGTTSNTIVLTNDTTAVTGYAANEGIFYICSTGNTNTTNLGVELAVGDWLLSTGSSWKKIDNTDAVTSVNTKIGAVVLYGTDIAMSSTDNTTVKDAIKITNATVGSSGSGNAITSLSISGGQLTATKGSTFLTSVGYSDLPDVAKHSLVYGGTVMPNAGLNPQASPNADAKAKNGATGSIVLTNDTTAVTGYGANQGIFYIYEGAASMSFAGLTFVDGDILYSTGSAWKKIDNTDSVTSVNNKTGAVTLYGSDIAVSSSDSTKIDTALSGKADKVTTTAGTYSAVTVNTQGLVTSGGQVIEVIANGGTPSVVTGGWYFEKDT